MVVDGPIDKRPIEPVTRPLIDAVSATLNGQSTGGKTLCALHQAAHHLGVAAFTPA